MIYVLILLIVFTLLLICDVVLYVKTINRVGPQWNHWLGSGFWVAWKFREQRDSHE